MTSPCLNLLEQVDDQISEHWETIRCLYHTRETLIKNIERSKYNPEIKALRQELELLRD